MVSGETLEMQEEKVEPLLNWPTPKTLKEVESFRGLAGYYRQFIPKFSDKMKPMNGMLRKGEFVWNE